MCYFHVILNVKKYMMGFSRDLQHEILKDVTEMHYALNEGLYVTVLKD